MQRWAHRTLAGLLAVVLLTAACGGDPSDESAGASVGSVAAPPGSIEAAPDPISPSTTVAPSSTAVAATVETVADCIARAPLAAALGQLVLAITAQDGIPNLVDAVVEGVVGGIVLVEDADADIDESIAPMLAAWPPPVIAVDEEGGAVSRLDASLGPQPSAQQISATGDPTAAFEAGRARAEGARALGFTMILAPVLDVGGAAVSNTRSYGTEADVVAEFGLAYADGIAAGGLTAVAKHFPGHGGADGDSHLRLPTTPSLDDLRAVDLVPFAAAVERVPVMMLGHLDVPGLTDGEPASVSVPAIALLRDELGFEGLIVTDDLTMAALRPRTAAEAAEAALAAGNDLLIVGGIDDAREAVDRLAAAVAEGRIERDRVDDALGRVLDVKGVDPCAVW